MNAAPTGEQYVGPSGGLKKPSEWLASEDLPLDREIEVTIEDVLLFRDVKFDAGRVEPKVAALKFAGKEKRMILNSTNRKRLVKMFTSDTREWRGKAVSLYVDPNVRMGRDTVNGLRIKLAE